MTAFSAGSKKMLMKVPSTSLREAAHVLHLISREEFRSDAFLTNLIFISKYNINSNNEIMTDKLNYLYCNVKTCHFYVRD